MDRKFGKSWSKIPTRRNNNYLLACPLPLAISYNFFKNRTETHKLITHNTEYQKDEQHCSQQNQGG